MRPAARILINGEDISTEMFGENAVLVSMTINDEAGTKADTLEIELDDREGFKAPPKNAEIQVWLGYEPQPTYMGRYKVDEWMKAGPERRLTISAKSAEMTGTIRAAKSRGWDDKTVGEIVREVAEANGLQAIVDESLAVLAISHIDQQNESDLAFLTRLAGRVGGVFKLSDGKVLFAARGSSVLPSGDDKPIIELVPAMVSDWDCTSAQRGDYGAVICTYMDHAAGRRVSVEEGGGTPRHRDRRVYASEAEARASARAQMGDLKRGKKTFASRGPGLPVVFAEARLQAEGFDPDVDGEYLIKSVSHSLSSGGYTTSISAETGKDDEAEV